MFLSPGSRGGRQSFFDGQGGFRFPGPMSIAPSLPVFGSLSTTFLNITGIWNTTGAPSALKLDLTDTASSANSCFIDARVSTQKFNVLKTGSVYLNWGSGSFTALGGVGITGPSGGTIHVGAVNGGAYIGRTEIFGADMFVGQVKASVRSAMFFGWSSDTTSFGTVDLSLFRAASKVLSVEANATAGNAGATIRFVANSPAQITADQNNYAPGGTSFFQRWNTDAARNITGLSLSQVDGQTHMIVNVGSNNIVLVHQSASSTAANRFLNSTGADITLSADQAADVIYDNTTARWRVYKRN